MNSKQALEVIKAEMKNDPGYAWAWHCNVSMIAFDAGAQHIESNIRAADFMQNVFEVDVRNYKEYKEIVKP